MSTERIVDALERLADVSEEQLHQLRQQQNAVMTALSSVQGELISAEVSLQTQIDRLTAGNPASLTALQNVADRFDPVVQQLAGLKPALTP